MTEKEFDSQIDVFNKLNKSDVSDRIEKKESGNKKLSYLSWAHAWAEAKKEYDIDYKIKEWDGKPYLFDPLLGYLVMTEMTIEGQTYEMWLPVMDHHNRAMKAEQYQITFSNGKSITVEPATMFDINKTIMRCLVKNLAMFGLGLYIYAGEDIPENDDGEFVRPPMTTESAKDVRVTFGKYSGEKIGDIFDKDIGYVTWLANESNNADIKEAANALLDNVQDDDKEKPKDKSVAQGFETKEYDELMDRLDKVAEILGQDPEKLNDFIFQEVSKEINIKTDELDDKTIPVYNKYLRMLETKAKVKETDKSKKEEQAEQSGLFEGNSTKPVNWGE